MARAYYSASIGEFISTSNDEVLGALVRASSFDVTAEQTAAWLEQTALLRPVVEPYVGRGAIHFEFVIPRLGRRVDNVLILDHAIVVLEFKVGERAVRRADVDQVWDYALDLKNFHDASHRPKIFPILVLTESKVLDVGLLSLAHDGVAEPIVVSPSGLSQALSQCLGEGCSDSVEVMEWVRGRYSPSPTIVEAATALFAGHTVSEIARSGADGENLSVTSAAVEQLIECARRDKQKVLCLVTGVPGAGKTLVGLNVASRHRDLSSELYSVFLSGNGPLVAVMREALARDAVARAKLEQRRLTKSSARQAIESVIQNVHRFRDDCLEDLLPPKEHVAIFDEAQRAWDREQTASFLRRKRGHANFDMSEAEFLISCLDRHSDWAVVVALVGGGQEIHTGEAGISAWIDAVAGRFPHWKVHLSPQLRQSEYRAEQSVVRLASGSQLMLDESLHLRTSMRSFRAGGVAEWVRCVLDAELSQAADVFAAFSERFQIRLTRDLEKGRAWVRRQARGSERMGLMVSSKALRLKPLAIDVRAPVDPVHWFLADGTDTRSSQYLEDAATEFQVQGLEVDWSCVVWDADLRRSGSTWQHWEFVGAGWRRVVAAERRAYLLNAYRVLLTRARQGMVIVVPAGNALDATRDAAFYDDTYRFLRTTGVPELA